MPDEKRKLENGRKLREDSDGLKQIGKKEIEFETPKASIRSFMLVFKKDCH